MSSDEANPKTGTTEDPSSRLQTEPSKEEGADSSGPLMKSLGSVWGGWMSDVGGYATSITEKLQKTVGQANTLLTEFQDEQKKFEREKQRVKDTAVPPWVGYNEEEQIKAQILELSADSRTVLRQPPPGVQFHFEFRKSFPVAQAILKEDKRLQKLRFDLVPKKISEEKFWHNYFYRVFLVKQSSQLASLATSEHANTIQDKPDHPNVDTSPTESSPTRVEPSTVEPASPVDDFASDALGSSTTEQTIDRESMVNELEQLGVATTTATTTDEWEDELARELEDLGVSTEEVMDKNQADDDQQWEDEIERMLELHSDNSN